MIRANLTAKGRWLVMAAHVAWIIPALGLVHGRDDPHVVPVLQSLAILVVWGAAWCLGVPAAVTVRRRFGWVGAVAFTDMVFTTIGLVALSLQQGQLAVATFASVAWAVVFGPAQFAAWITAAFVDGAKPVPQSP